MHAISACVIYISVVLIFRHVPINFSAIALLFSICIRYDDAARYGTSNKFFFYYFKGVTNLKNLGGTFGTTSLNNGRSGKCATSGFVCTFSELSCPYGAGSDNSDNLWVKTSGRPDQEIWSNSVGTSVVPGIVHKKHKWLF